MATLEKIRSKAALLVIVVGLALFAFIIGDFLRSSTTFFNQKKENIAVVDGQTIKIQDFQRKVEEQTNRLKGRGASSDEDQTNQIRQATLEEWINKILLKEESKKVGFTVSKDELRDLIMGDDAHLSPQIQQMQNFKDPQTGRLDRNSFLQFLQTIESDDYSQFSQEALPQILAAKQDWLEIEDRVILQQLQSKLAAFLSVALAPNKLDAQAAYDENKTNVDFAYVSKTYSSLPDDSVGVSDAEIAKLYNERKAGLKQEEAKIIDYIAVNILPSEQDYRNVLDKMEAAKTRLTETTNPGNVVTEISELPYLDAFVAYDQLSGDEKSFVDHASPGTVDGPILNKNIYSLYRLLDTNTAPDSIKLNIIPLPVRSANEKEIKQVGDSLIDLIKSGTSFAEIVASYYGKQADNGNWQSWQTESELAKQGDMDFKNEVFGLALNEIKVIRSSLGNFLIQVVEKTAPVKKYKIATVQLTVSPSQETKTKIYNELNQYISANHNLDAFKKSAAEAGYNIQTNIEVAQKQLNLSGIKNTRQVIQWAFKNKKGDISNIFECQNQEYFVVAAVEGTLKEGYRPLAAVSDILKRELLNEKKGDKIVAGLKAGNFTDIEQYAEALNTTVDSVKFVTFSTPRIARIGNEPVLNVEAPLLAVGQTAGPYKGKTGVYVIKITDKKDSEQPFDENMQKQTLQMQNGYRLYQWMQSNQILKESAKIEDNFSRFF